MVGNLVEGGFEIVEALRPRAGAREIEAVLGWQPLLANREMPCAHCAKRIPKGGQAFISVGAPGGRNYVICEECKCELQ